MPSFFIASRAAGVCKKTTEDKQALDKITISKTSATYINSHGVAHAFKLEFKDQLKGKMFSQNVDKATNNNNDKILNVLVQYYDEDSGQIELAHLGSRKQKLATALNIMESLDSILMEYALERCQILSVLMDNCSTMRGKKDGVEALKILISWTLVVTGCT